MAAINYAGNTYPGEVLEDLLRYTVEENDTFKEGLIHIRTGIQKKFVLPHINLGKIIQDNVATPTSTQGGQKTDDATFNQYTISERYLEPEDYMIYLEFNPRDFEQYWRPFQPEGPLVFRDLDPRVQAKMLQLLLDKKDQYINDSIWGSRKGGSDATKVTGPSATDAVVLGGEAAAGPMKYFNGALMRMLINLAEQAKTAGADANELASGKVILAGNAEITTGKGVEDALYAMWRTCPKQIRKHSALKYVMGWDLWDLYDQYLTTEKDYKYVENPELNKFRFKGKRVVVINGIPDSTIFLGKFTSDENSCLWMGVDYATDQDSIKVERLQANSELYFFQMRLKMDVNIVLPGEIIVWTPYKLAA